MIEVPKETEDQLVPEVIVDVLGHKVQLEIEALKEIQETWVPEELQVLLVQRESQAARDLGVSRDLKETKEKRMIKALKGPLFFPQRHMVDQDGGELHTST